MRGKDNTKAIPYLLPALVSILIVTCIPIIYTIVISFTNYNMYHLNDFTFIAFQNYLTVFSGSLKDVFFPVLGWTVCFAVLSTLGSYTMGLGLAILLNNPKMKESKVYKTILIVPWALPSTIAILAWQGLLNEQYGGINNSCARYYSQYPMDDGRTLGTDRHHHCECLARVSLYDECLPRRTSGDLE